MKSSILAGIVVISTLACERAATTANNNVTDSSSSETEGSTALAADVYNRNGASFVNGRVQGTYNLRFKEGGVVRTLTYKQAQTLLLTPPPMLSGGKKTWLQAQMAQWPRRGKDIATFDDHGHLRALDKRGQVRTLDPAAVAALQSRHPTVVQEFTPAQIEWILRHAQLGGSGAAAAAPLSPRRAVPAAAAPAGHAGAAAAPADLVTPRYTANTLPNVPQTPADWRPAQRGNLYTQYAAQPGFRSVVGFYDRQDSHGVFANTNGDPFIMYGATGHAESHFQARKLDFLQRQGIFNSAIHGTSRVPLSYAQIVAALETRPPGSLQRTLAGKYVDAGGAAADISSWQRHSVDVMADVVLARYQRERRFQAALDGLPSGTLVIEAAGANDAFYGAGAATGGGIFTGENTLGAILTTMNEFRHQKGSAQILPPSLPLPVPQGIPR